MDQSRNRLFAAPRRLLRLVVVPLLVAGFALTAAPATATHVMCGHVAMTDVKLDSDLLNCPGDGIVVGAPGITINLAGHTVDGVNGAQQGIQNFSGHDGVTIMNGTVQEFSSGIFHSNANQTVTTRITSNNRFGITLAASDFGLVEKSTVFNTATTMQGNGITLQTGSDDNVVEKNNVSNTTSDGIILFTSDRNLISKNVSNSNFLSGISMQPGSDDNVIEKNESFANDIFDGIVVAGGNNNRVEKNTVYDNARFGISLNNSNGTLILQNRALSNTSDGIFGNSGSNGTLLEKNDAHENGDDGIETDSPSTTFTKNTANNNVDLGIDAAPGSIDGGGNKARGNGNPAQCTGVSCN